MLKVLQSVTTEEYRIIGHEKDLKRFLGCCDVLGRPFVFVDCVVYDSIHDAYCVCFEDTFKIDLDKIKDLCVSKINDVVIHELIHSLGVVDEDVTYRLTLKLDKNVFFERLWCLYA